MLEKIQRQGLDAWSFACQTKEEFEAKRLVEKQARNYNSGFNEWGKALDNGGTSVPINQGLYTSTTSGGEDKLLLGRTGSDGEGVSKTSFPITSVAGVVSEVYSGGFASDSADFQFPQAPNGATTYDSATGTIVEHADAATAFAAETATNKVVTERVDMFGCEYFLREVTQADSWVYAKGAIQSQATAMNGVSTVANTQRPQSYFDQYEGQNGSKGRGVDFWNASDEDKLAIVSDPTNNIYYDDGKVYQWCYRFRTFAGAGNGDWDAVDSSLPNTVNVGILSYRNLARVVAQGNLDANDSLADTVAVFVNKQSSLDGYVDKQAGVYTLRNHTQNDGKAIDGECYFQVMGTVNRLNQGVKTIRNDLGAAKTSDDKFWYDTALTINTLADAFNPANILTGSGAIASGKSGRPDGRFYDAIYANGQGGAAQDLRLSVTEDLDKSISTRKAQDKNGGTRGREKLVKTQVFPSVGDVPAGWTVQNQDNVAAVVAFVGLDISVGDEYNQTDVIGDPANILLTDALKDGWFGSWIPVIPSVANVSVPLTRKAISTSASQAFTLNNGTSWSTNTWPISAVTNDRTYITGVGVVAILNYTAHTKHTEPTANPVVYRGEDGLGSVFVTEHYDVSVGNLLSESLTGEVLKSNASGTKWEGLTLPKYTFSAIGKLDTSASYPTKHTPVEIVAPNNNSPAMKALFATTMVSGLVYPVYYYTELIHDGTDWGDDSLVHIVDNDGTMTDLNGNTVKVGIHLGKDPIGFEQK